MNAEKFLYYYNNINSLDDKELSLFQQTLDLLKIKYKDKYKEVINKENIDKIDEIIKVRDELREKSKDNKKRENYLKKRREIINKKKKLYNEINEFFKEEVENLREEVITDFIIDFKKNIKKYIIPDSVMNQIKKVTKKSKITVQQLINKLKKEGIEVKDSFILLTKDLSLLLGKLENIPISGEAADKEEYTYKVQDITIEIRLEESNKLLIRNLNDKEISIILIIKEDNNIHLISIEEYSSKIIPLSVEVKNIKDDITIQYVP